MSEFSNVTVVKQANVYFNGGVVSRTIRFADGSTRTLGFMQPGEYRFNTGAPELVEILSGELEVQLPGDPQWQKFAGGGSFSVPGDASFHLRVHQPVDYCCSFLD